MTVKGKSFIVQGWEGSSFGGTLSEKSVRHSKIVQKSEGVQVCEVSCTYNSMVVIELCAARKRNLITLCFQRFS